MNKIFLSLLFIIFSLSISQAQDSQEFSKNGRWAIESGAGFLGLIGNNTGSTFLFSEGVTIGTLSFEGGKFISENFVVLAKLSYFTSGDSFDVTTIGLGGKYYAGGIIPIKFGGGANIVSGFGGSESEFIGNVSVGYAAKLAPNIFMEPNIGALFSGDVVAAAAVTFALILGN